MDSMLNRMLDQSSEQPLYSIYQSKTRALIPKTTSLLLLASIFYLGVLVNISLLELDAQQETSLKTGSFLLLTALIVMGLALTLRKTRQPYIFYRNRLTHGKKTVYYSNITNASSPHTNMVDKMFKTYSIQLEGSFFIRNIPEEVQLSNYIQQLKEFSKKSNY